MKNDTKNQYVGIVVALAVAGFMFYGMSYIYIHKLLAKIINKKAV